VTAPSPSDTTPSPTTPLPTTRQSSTTQSNEAAPRTPADDRLVIGLLLVSAFVVILNETIMGVAIPHLVVDLGITANAAQWLTTAFMLTMAVVIPITGFLLQRFNTRPIFLAAMSLFSAGTLVAALAPGFEALLVGRVIQASGTAIMMPLLMTTVLTLVPPATRGRTMGNISIVISVAPAIGPSISGLILSAFEWRWMFGIVFPIAIAALVLGAVKVRNVTTPKPAPLDVLSVIFSALAFSGIVYGLSSLTESVTVGVSTLAVGVVFLAAFIIRQIGLQRVERALLDLRTFLSKTFTLAIVMMAISMMAMFGSFIVLPFYLQGVLGLEVLQTGLLLLPGGLLMGILSPIVGRLYDRFGPTVLLVPGAITVSAVFWALTMLTPTTPVWLVLIAHIALSAGLAFLFTPLFTAGLGALTPNLYSHGSAVLGTVQQLAGAAGTALFVTVMSSKALSLGAGGASEAVATTGGVTSAFLYGAIISMGAIVVAFFIRKPADSIGGTPMVH